MSPETSKSFFPSHIAIIMDGNGRWAKAKKRPRVFGHREGAKTVKTITSECARLGIKQLTLYALSTENVVNRPKAEFKALMQVLKQYVVGERGTFTKERIKLAVIGDLDALPKGTVKEVKETIRMTEDNDRMTLCLALNYGSRDEICRATRKIAEKVSEGEISPDDINEELFSSYLDTAGMSEPDLLIRTAHERRLSNYLLWQLSYAEFMFTPILWPDFKEEALKEAIEEYAGRNRTYGGLKP